MKELKEREGFGSKLGIIAVAAGSAIGLGNIWRFPYITGKHGGAAFLIVYLLCVLILGLPVMVTEFAIGRKGQANASSSFDNIIGNKKWGFIGTIGIATAFLIMSFYSVIAGWLISYIVRGISGSLSTITSSNIGEYFTSIISSTTEPILGSLIIIIITSIIVFLGVKNGIEKFSKILMPILLILLFGLMIRSLSLPGAFEGVKFLFKPDFSLLTGEAILDALGHSFYSLSLGMGIIITYGSYIGKKESIPGLAVQVTIADTLIALMAGLVIFPAVFAYGLDPQSGTTLLFQTLPIVFNEMPFGNIFAILFFSLVLIAAITSTVSLMEVFVSYASEKFKISRKKATITSAVVVFLLSIPCALSFGALSNITILNKSIFDFLDALTNNVLLPIGGILVCIFAGWIWKTRYVIDEITNGELRKFKLGFLYSFIIKYVAPVLIGVVLLNSLGIF
ncbi:neurotransmitter:Na+ symporter, NSS family [Clostridium collagenovorans DSM 3089]|uniref:Transporter n=1 Tax=Clostridium collagenovorans DSM 3089 TaxID=1121306 RepID=A0A1M5TQZ6_9CLOT|nr:sodium-dependent transporter [Clostridium collagenovorans]SHH53144.1 neurotransmitter:Na+ symporter, NSS family [Clostridium collagenovorans DSM 3089]